MSPSISILVPTRGRPNQLLTMLESVFATASRPESVDVAVYIDDDDEPTLALDLGRYNVRRIVGPRQSMGTMNAACFAATKGDIVMLCNDDVIVRTKNWDARIREEAARFPDQVFLFYPNDLYKGQDLATFPVLSRLTCDEIADPFPGEYRGAFIDVHVLDIFTQVGGGGHDRIVFLKDVVFEHMHPRAGKAEVDTTYKERDRFIDDRTFMALTGAREWAANRLLALIRGEASDPDSPFEESKPMAGWFINLTLQVLLKGRAKPAWRLKLFIWLWLRFGYRRLLFVTPLVSQRLVIVFAFLMPLTGVLASKGMTTLVVVTGLAGLARWVQEGFPRISLGASLLAALAGLVVWSAVTTGWAFHPGKALFLVGRLAFLLTAGIGVLFAVSQLDDKYRRAAENALLAGMALGLAALTVGFGYAEITGDALWTTFKSSPLTTLNNGAVAISLLSWPAFALLWRRGYKKLFAALAFSVYAGFMFLESGAALLAPVVGMAGFFVVWLWRRSGAMAVAVLVAGLVLFSPQIVVSPLIGTIIEKAETVVSSSVSHRVKIWSFVVEKIDEKPFLGWGMDASRSIPKEDRRIDPETEILPLHPHNAFLQVRLELGLPGAVLLAALVGLFFAAAGKIEQRFSSAVTVGTGLSYLSVAAVSYGVWQNWWWAFAWALAAMTMLALKSSPPDTS